jgi:hydroxyacylglutathione hydrolase
MAIVTIPGRDYDSNVYVIPGKTPSIIDTGTGFHSPELLEIIQETLQLDTIVQILLTHEHFDHVGGVLDIKQATGDTAKIYAHKDVVSKLREGKSTFAEMLGGHMPNVKVDVPLVGGEHLILGDDLYTVILTPGHSIGSLCLYGEKNHSLFSGDTVFANGGFGRYDFPGGDFNTLLGSVEHLASLEVQSLYPGHGPIVEHKGKQHVNQSLKNIRSLV